MVKFTSDASADTLPDKVFGVDIEKIIEAGDDKSDRKVALSLAKLAAIMQDFCLFCFKKNEIN